MAKLHIRVMSWLFALGATVVDRLAAWIARAANCPLSNISFFFRFTTTTTYYFRILSTMSDPFTDPPQNKASRIFFYTDVGRCVGMPYIRHSWPPEHALTLLI